ncbi:head-tail adaptor protein [uncultured Brevundimonas sp.]|uniref:head-tail adaptor protein n=1 Tax=uncultured Brevundimonas sp. TaxID=213418 RepID=UPI0026124671|nr:head-tail adaptor protein [uncultured Brevundimonas sp.]
MPKPKGAGDLRQRVRFERRGAGTDADGNAVAAWTDLGISRACALAPTRGGEEVQAGRIAGRASWDCWVRSDSGTRTIQPGDRAVNTRTGETFNIAFVGDMDGGRTWLLIQMTSGGVDG